MPKSGECGDWSETETDIFWQLDALLIEVQHDPAVCGHCVFLHYNFYSSLNSVLTDVSLLQREEFPGIESVYDH